MRYPEHVIEEVREKSDIVSIISEYTALTKKGHSYTGLCPFHSEKTPSFSVSEDKQLYYCFGCGAGGNVITFLMQKESMTFIETIKYLAERENIKLDETYLSEEEVEKNKKRQHLLEILKESARFFHYQLRQEQHKSALTYLTDRGLSLETIKQFGLGYASPQFNELYEYLKQKGYSDELLLESGLFLSSKNSQMPYDRFADRIIFPIFDLSKKVIAFGGRVLDGSLPKYLNSPENLLFNKSRVLYGLHLAKTSSSSYFILVEGYMDVIAMHQAGFNQTIASLGTAFTPGHAKLIKRHVKEVVILYDSDGAGQKAALRAIPILRNEGIKVKVLQLKEGKDPDEFLKTHGYEAMKKLIEEAPVDIWFQVLHVEKKYQLSNPEEKVKFLQEIATILAESSSSIEQAIYIGEICSKYQIDEAAFKAEMNQHQGQILKRVREKAKEPPSMMQKQQLFNNEVIFLATLYHYPQLGRHILKYIKPEMFQEELLYDLAKAIMENLEMGDEVDLNYFTTKYPEVNEQNIISHVLIYKDQRYENMEILQKMMTENVKRLNKTYIEKRLKQTTDIKEVQNLLFQKKELDKLNIDYING